MDRDLAQYLENQKLAALRTKLVVAEKALAPIERWCSRVDPRGKQYESTTSIHEKRVLLRKQVALIKKEVGLFMEEMELNEKDRGLRWQETGYFTLLAYLEAREVVRD